MNWKYKAYLQKVLDSIPFGRNINYFMQRNITKNLPVDDSTFFQKFDFSFKQISEFRKYNNIKLSEIKSLEFGAGWDMLTPLSYSLLGLKNQTVVDLYQNMKPDLINNSIQRFNEKKSILEKKYEIELKKLSDIQIGGFDDLKNHYNINYQAPVDMANTNYPDNSFDFIHSLSTMEHIPESTLEKIFNECYRILKSGGIFSGIIDLRDHYSYFDKDISIYNFLQFSESKWKRYNHFLQYQNRLRVGDYLSMIEMSDFKIKKMDLIKADKNEKLQLEKLDLDDKFQHSTQEQTGIKEMFFVLLKE